MLLDHIVVDVETSFLMDEVEGRDLAKLGVGVAVVYSCIDDSFSVYKQDAVSELKSRILEADKITGFNIWKFDYPVIWGLSLHDWLKSQDAARILPKTNDILRRAWISMGLDPMQFTKDHKGLSLRVLASATLGTDKDDMGKLAPSLMREGKWDIVTSYCLQDVRLTRDLANFVDNYGYVINGRDDVIRVWAEPNEVV